MLTELDKIQGMCDVREDGAHCDHWWDGEPIGDDGFIGKCCACGYTSAYIEGKVETPEQSARYLASRGP